MVQAWVASPSPDPTPAALGSCRQTGLSSDPNTRPRRHPNVQMSALDACLASGRRVSRGLATESPSPPRLARKMCVDASW